MNTINTAIRAIRQRINRREKITLILKRISLSILRTRIYTPTTVITDVPIRETNHAHNANPATHKPNFMMIPEVREFCFNMFFPFLIIMTFFFMRHPSDRSFLFHRATKGIVGQTGIFFRQ